MTDFLKRLDELREKATTCGGEASLESHLRNHADEIAELVRAAKELHRLKLLKVELERRMRTEGDVMSETAYRMRQEYEDNKEGAWLAMSIALAALKEKS